MTFSKRDKQIIYEWMDGLEEDRGLERPKSTTYKGFDIKVVKRQSMSNGGSGRGRGYLYLIVLKINGKKVWYTLDDTGDSGTQNDGRYHGIVWRGRVPENVAEAFGDREGMKDY